MNDDITANAFIKYQNSLASRLRYGQTIMNLKAMHNLSRPRAILDAAGGNGLNTEYFLELGHEVTLLDSDLAMLDEARSRLGERGLLGKCTFVHCDLESMDGVVESAQFDLILCHHVLEYTDQSPAILKSFHSLVGRTGELSLITLNPVSEVVRSIIFKCDPLMAASKLTDLRYDAMWFGDAQLYHYDLMESWAVQAGWALKDFRAIRVLADYLTEANLDDDKESQLLDLEERLSSLEPYRRMGRYLQFCFIRE